MIKHFLATALTALAILFSPGAYGQVFTSDDITVVITTTGVHDSIYCHTSAHHVYDITINNSYLGDTCQVIEMIYPAPPLTLVNTTGENPWHVVTSGNHLIRDQDILDDTAHFVFTDYQTLKFVTDHDTLINVVPAAFDFYVPDHCPHAPVSGRVYIDQNNDCVYNAGDDILSYMWVKADVYGSNPNIFEYTDYDMVDPNGGEYHMNILSGDMDSVVMQLPPEWQFIFPASSCGPIVQTITSIPQANIDFPLQCSSNIDLYVSGGAAGVVRPNIPFLFHPFVANMGCDAVAGTLKLVLDPNVVYDPLLSSNPAVTVSGDTLIWYYSDLSNLVGGGYWNGFGGSIHLTPTLAVNIGDELCFTVLTDVPVNDIYPPNNTMTICLPVVNSYDPNMKEVSPAGTGTIGAIAPETEKLTYTIHFQNTGNAEAYNVSVIDTLDTDLDPSTLRILATSHTMAPQWVGPGVVAFIFNDIHLADSTSNEPASHGFVTFEIGLDAALPIGTVIENTGHIFFDFNDAIVTNTTVNTLSELAGIPEGQPVDVTVFPNPASGILTIEGEGIEWVSLVDFSGKTVLRASALTDSQVDVSALNNGIYLLHIETSHGVAIRKLVISH